MAEPFIGEIRLFPYGWAPLNWQLCDGSLQQIRLYPALYAILGSRYGGDAQQTFALPDLRARVAVNYGDNPSDTFDPAIAAAGGNETVALTSVTVPPHNHSLVGAQLSTTRAEVDSPADNWLSIPLLVKQPKGSEISAAFVPSSTTPNATLAAGTLSPYSGVAGAHSNLQPYLVLGYYIAMEGEFAPNPN